MAASVRCVGKPRARLEATHCRFDPASACHNLLLSGKPSTLLCDYLKMPITLCERALVTTG